MEQAETSGAQGNYVCPLHSEGGIYRQLFTPPLFFFFRQKRARTLVPGLAWEVPPKVNGLLVRPLGLRAGLRFLHARSLSITIGQVSASASRERFRGTSLAFSVGRRAVSTFR